MLKMKLALSAGIIAFTFLFPISAFASSNTTTYTYTNQSSQYNSSFLASLNQLLSKIVPGVFANKDYDQFEKWSTTDKKDYDDFKSWYDRNKNDCPDTSFQIWQKWFCY
ncbi:hypothetical protein [Paenibacillus cremeus]|uniref:Uncharacterized protein n=1 Tax=Paenibacillus cremeus TaxID=2163881 RepID=A0A559JML1_9BACL|nr:hypothetical protein [Paenibacillus cremeus]TVY01096.1 hypothetical protein FPZ49_32550 [Paenibacillus cremeus]